MKKIAISIITIILMMITTSVRAEGVTTQIKENNMIKENGEYEITISFLGNEGLLGVQGKIEYDKNIFEYKEIEIKKAGWTITSFNEETGIFMAEVPDEGFTDTTYQLKTGEELATFKFKLKDGVKNPTTQISIKEVELVDNSYNTINQIETKTVKISGGTNVYTYIIVGGIVLILVAVVIMRKKR